MVPASEAMSASLSASTLKAPPLVFWLPPTTMACTSDSITLLVTLPLMAVVPAPLPEAATERIEPSSLASTVTATGATNTESFRRAVTLKSAGPLPMWLTAIEPPMAPVPPPDTAPASDSMLPACAACTVSVVAAPLMVVLSTLDKVVPLSTLVLDEPAAA